MERVYDIAGAAKYLGCCVRTVRREIQAGELRAYRVSRRTIRIAESWLREYRESHLVADPISDPKRGESGV